MNKNENTSINLLSAHQIVKYFYYKIFLMHKPDKYPSLNHVNYLIGSGGVGKTHSSNVASIFLNNINIKTMVISLKNLSSIEEIKNKIKDCKVIIFDALNEANDINKLHQEITNLLDGNKLIIINSRRIEALSKISEDFIYSLNYDEAYESFINENRIFEEVEKQSLWENILKFYKPVFTGNDFKFETNLRTLRMLYDAICKIRLASNGDSAIIQIRKTFEYILKKDLLEKKSSWDNFKKNIYNFDENKIDLNSLPKDDIDILEKFDILRINNSKIEIKDFNMIDHLITLKVINSFKNDEKILTNKNDFESDISKLIDFIENIENYNSDKTTLKMMIIYEYLFRLTKSSEKIDHEIIKHFLLDKKTRKNAMMTISLMNFSNGAFDYLKGHKIYLSEIAFEEYLALSEIFYIIFNKIVPLNKFSDEPFYEGGENYLKSISYLTSKNFENEIFNVNIIDIISFQISNDFDTQTISDHLSVWAYEFSRQNEPSKINDLIKCAINHKIVCNSKSDFKWRKSKSYLYIYSLLIISKMLQNFLILDKKIYKIETKNFNIFDIKKTLSFKNLNKIITIDDSVFSENESSVSNGYGKICKSWSVSLLDDISQLTDSTTEYDKSKSFIKFTKVYSNKYKGRKRRYSFANKNRHEFEYKVLKKEQSILETFKLDKYLGEKPYKSLLIKDFIDFKEENEIFEVGGYKIYSDSWGGGYNTISNIYFSSKEKLPLKIQNSFNVIISNINDVDLINKNIKIFSEYIHKEGINLIIYVNPESKLKTFNVNKLNYNTITMINDVSFEKYYDSNNWITPAVNHISNLKNSKTFFDGNRTLFLKDENANEFKTFKLKRRYSVNEPNYPIGLDNEVEWSYVLFKIRKDGTFKSKVTIGGKKCIEFDSRNNSKKEYEFNGNDVRYIK